MFSSAVYRDYSAVDGDCSAVHRDCSAVYGDTIFPQILCFFDRSDLYRTD